MPPALHHSSFRYYWGGLISAVIGYQGFLFLEFALMHQLEGSAWALGVLGVATGVPAIVLGVAGGVAADRVDKRWLIGLTQSGIMLGLAGLGLLTLTRTVQVWHVLTLSMVIASLSSFDSPARSAYFPRLVPREALISAVALNSLVWQSTRVVGPAVAGVVVALVSSEPMTGIAVAFLASAILVAIMPVMMVLVRVPGPGLAERNPLRDLADAVRYAAEDRVVGFLLVLSYLQALLGWSYVVLMPVFAADVLGVGIDRQGGLLASAGAGASIVTVALAMGGAGLARRRGWMVIGGAASTGVALAGFALTARWVGSYPLALGLIFVVGFTQTLFNTGAMGALQLIIPDAYRGRVLGLYAIVWGIMPLSGTQAAALARLTGVPVAVALGGALITVLALAALASPTIRGLRQGEPPAPGPIPAPNTPEPKR
ncbi:MAG: MFS transporter [Chloroflexota bacterium]